jgi:hypothetical protein
VNIQEGKLTRHMEHRLLKNLKNTSTTSITEKAIRFNRKKKYTRYRKVENENNEIRKKKSDHKKLCIALNIKTRLIISKINILFFQLTSGSLIHSNIN